MTATDVKGILALLQSEYPQSFSRMDQRTMQAKVNLWAEMFADDDPKLVFGAVKSLLTDGRDFAPTIGQIKNRMHDLTDPEVLTEGEAWALVSRACSNGIYGYQKEFDKLPPDVQAAVGRAEQLREWAMMEEETVQSVIASNFMRAYKSTTKRTRAREMLPESVRTLIDGITGNMASLPEPHTELTDEIDRRSLP